MRAFQQPTAFDDGYFPELALVGDASLRTLETPSGDYSEVVLPSHKAFILRAKPSSAEIEHVEAYWSLPASEQTLKLGARPMTKSYNVKVEAVANTPAFRDAFAERRCLVPARVWYECSYRRRPRTLWQITRKGGGTVFFAGLWQQFDDRENGTIDRFTVITEPAGYPLKAFVDDVPVALWGSDGAIWLDPKTSIHELYQVLGPESPDGFDMQKVSDFKLKQRLCIREERPSRPVPSITERAARTAEHLSAMASKLESVGRVLEAACYRRDVEKLVQRHKALSDESRFLRRRPPFAQ